MTTLEQLKAKIVEANPEIMELKNGCRIGDGIIWEGSWYGKSYGEMTDNLDFPENEILGRPIRLADVLYAIGKMKLYYVVFVDQEGGFGTAIAGQNPKLFSVMRGWNLLKDSLGEQSPECIELLAKILL